MKHFTDAELAAEYWRAELEVHKHWYTEALPFLTEELDTWKRFVTLPDATDA